MNPVADPTYFILTMILYYSAGSLCPSLGTLSISNLVIYEAIGTIWTRFKVHLQNSQ